VFEHTNDNHNYLQYFFNAPQSGLAAGGLHPYSCFIWELFLAQKFDTSLMVSIWNGARFGQIADVLGDTLEANYGWSRDSAFAEFALWNYFTGWRWTEGYHEEGLFYPEIAIAAEHSFYPLIPTGITSTRRPAGYAAAYVKFLPGLSEGNLRLTFDGADTRNWAAWVVKSYSDSEHVVEKMQLSDTHHQGTHEVFGFDDCAYVTLIGVNLSLGAASENFFYTAELFGDYAVSSRMVTTDSLVYSGTMREFDYQVNNPSPLNDVYDVIFWDDSGWVGADTIDVFVASGDSAIVPIPVTAPVGTLLGSRSEFFCKAVSKNDASVFDQQSAVATTVLQRGDLNFDGLIDIGDITHLIAFLYLNGPDPIPLMEAGDMDCADEIDIGDLTYIVRYLYLNGSGAPCNPL
jgi:hypothetical protein